MEPSAKSTTPIVATAGGPPKVKEKPWYRALPQPAGTERENRQQKTVGVNVTADTDRGECCQDPKCARKAPCNSTASVPKEKKK